MRYDRIRGYSDSICVTNPGNLKLTNIRKVRPSKEQESISAMSLIGKNPISLLICTPCNKVYSRTLCIGDDILWVLYGWKAVHQPNIYCNLPAPVLLTGLPFTVVQKLETVTQSYLPLGLFGGCSTEFAQ